MSRPIRVIAYIGNGALLLFCVISIMALLSRGLYTGPAVAFALVCGLSVFNLRLIWKVSATSSEEEWLASELRKAEMRRQLVDLAGQGLTDVVPSDVMAKHKSESSTSAP